MISDKELLDLVLENGATKAAFIPVEKIVLSSYFREVCQGNQCGGYGACWVCPPDLGDIQPLMNKIRSFPRGILYQTISEIEDSFDFEGMMDAGRHHSDVSQKIEGEVIPKITCKLLHLSCGGCRLCERCGKKDNIPCRHPDKALGSLEGYGVDVYKTTKATDLKYINGENTITYFGLIMLAE